MDMLKTELCRLGEYIHQDFSFGFECGYYVLSVEDTLFYAEGKK